MKENKKLYIIGTLKDSILISPTININYYKVERHKYIITKDLKKEFEGILYNGVYEDLKFDLDLKHFKIEVFD
jgi:hypothetical protein